MKCITLMLLPFALFACQNQSTNPTLASSLYPRELHQSGSVSIQVHRNDEFIEIVNSTANDYDNATLWINQRFSTELEANASRNYSEGESVVASGTNLANNLTLGASGVPMNLHRL